MSAITVIVVWIAAFTIVGTDIARDAGFPAGPAVVLGVISGIGGGIIRDVLAGKRISIFDGEVYALAAVASSVAFLLTQSFGEWVPFLTGVSVILIIRLGAVALGWQVPTLPTNSPHSREN